MSNRPSFRGSLYGNRQFQSFGDIDKFVDDMVGLRYAVAEQKEKLDATEERIEVDDEVFTRIRTLLELKDADGVVDGLIRRVNDWLEDEKVLEKRVQNVLRPLQAFALFGRTEFAQCDPTDMVFEGKDEEGNDILITYGDFQDAAKVAEREAPETSA